jgi:hypothetical protein
VILTPIAEADLPRALSGFGANLRGTARAALDRIAASLAHGGADDTPARRRQAVALARELAIPVLDEAPARAFSWDGRVLRTDSEAWVILHEVAHWLIAPPARRRRRDFGLGAGPETGRKDEADADRSVDEPQRAREEAQASLLGILWEAALGQPAIHAFLEQNWLEGWERSSAADYFTAIVDDLHGLGLIDADGRPRALRAAA